MGKASKWFRSLLSSKKSSESAPSSEKKKKNKWALPAPAGSSINHVQGPLSSPYVDGVDSNKHAIAVAAATAAVAEAALAAAQAAAEVVRLTSGGGSARSRPYFSGDQRAIFAVVKIQSAFRAYLARRALRALKGLVKLQALVRGHIVRKQSSDMLRRMQAMARIQARASAHRSYSSADIKLCNSHHHGDGDGMQAITNLGKYLRTSKNPQNCPSPVKQNHSRSSVGNKENSHLASRWLNHWMEQYNWNNLHETSPDDERSDKILEVDMWKPRQNTKQSHKTVPSSNYFSAWNKMEYDHQTFHPLSTPSSKLQKPNPSVSSEDVSSVRSSKFPPEGSTPRGHSTSSRPASNTRGPFTPLRSECSRSLFGDYLNHPSYMANTESSRAKLRSHSAPKQRMQFEENLKFGRGVWESDCISEKGSTYHVYPGQVKRHGTPNSNASSTGVSSVYHRQWL